MGILYTGEYISSTSELYSISNQLIKLNTDKTYFNDIDWIIFLLRHIDICFSIGKKQTAEPIMMECLGLCQNTRHSDHFKAVCLSYLCRYYCNNESIQQALSFLKEALSYCHKNHDSIIHQNTTVLVANQYYRSFGNYYVNKPEINQAIEFLLYTLHVVNSRQEAENLIDVFDLYLNLSRAYIHIENYDKALAYEKKAYQECNQLKKQGLDPINKKTAIGCEYGLTLLRLNKTQKALKILSSCIEMMLKTSANKKLVIPYVFRSEIYLRQGQYEKAYQDALSALQLRSASKNNYTKLIELHCYYNIMLACLKTKDIQSSLNYFNDFISKAQTFCKNFLDPKQYEILLAQHAFDLIKDPADIETCLDHSLLIFTAIYGSNHSFVKDFVEKKGKPDSWFSLLIRNIIPLAWIKN